jgi:hypothetical protein
MRDELKKYLTYILFPILIILPFVILIWDIYILTETVTMRLRGVPIPFIECFILVVFLLFSLYFIYKSIIMVSHTIEYDEKIKIYGKYIFIGFLFIFLRLIYFVVIIFINGFPSHHPNI